MSLTHYGFTWSCIDQITYTTVVAPSRLWCCSDLLALRQHAGWAEPREYVAFRWPPEDAGLQAGWLAEMELLIGDLHWLLRRPYHRYRPGVADAVLGPQGCPGITGLSWDHRAVLGPQGCPGITGLSWDCMLYPRTTDTIQDYRPYLRVTDTVKNYRHYPIATGTVQDYRHA